MEADVELRDVVSKLEDTSGEPGDLPALEAGEGVRRAARGAGASSTWPAWVLGGTLLGMIFGIFVTSVILGLRSPEGR